MFGVWRPIRQARAVYLYNSSQPSEVQFTNGPYANSFAYDAAGDIVHFGATSCYGYQLGYDARNRPLLYDRTYGATVQYHVAQLGYNGANQRALHAHFPTTAGSQPDLIAQFAYRDGRIGQVQFSGTSVTTPYTDAYVYRQDGAPLELVRQQGASTRRYWYVTDRQHSVVAVVILLLLRR